MPEVLFRTENLRKRYRDGTEIPAGIDLTIYEQECLVIAGSNGSGKTQCMKMLTGLANPDEGSIQYRGKPLKTALPGLRSEVGLVFQDTDSQLIGETVEEDIAFGPKNLGIRGTELTERVHHAMESLGLVDKRTVSPRRLSGGEKRRLAVAGVLAMGCTTLIMDEPFANLDWPGVMQVLTLVKQLKDENKTLILLTHELEKILAYADRLLILHQGKIWDDGDPESVLNRLKNEYGIRDPRHTYLKVEDCTWLN